MVPFIAWMLVSVAEAAEPLPEPFHFQFSSGIENQPVLKLIGPNARQAAGTDALGLRITLPAQRPRPFAVGVEPRFQLHGDFEVTLSYELLAAEPPPLPNGAGVILRLKLDKPTPRTVTLTRVRRRGKDKSSKDLFGTNLVTPGPDGKNKIDTKIVPASSTQGQLRLVRAGETLRFLVSDGPGAAFQEIRTLSLGTDDVKGLQVQCATGGKEGSVDARLIALNIRAAQLPNQPTHLKVESSGGSIGLWLGIIGFCLGAALLSYWWWARRRRGRESSPSDEPSPKKDCP